MLVLFFIFALALTLSHLLHLTLSLTFCLSLSLYLTFTLSPSPSLSLTLSHSLSLSLTLSHSLSLSLTLSYSHSLFHSHSMILFLTLPLSLSLTLSHSLSFSLALTFPHLFLCICLHFTLTDEDRCNYLYLRLQIFIKHLYSFEKFSLCFYQLVQVHSKKLRWFLCSEKGAIGFKEISLYFLVSIPDSIQLNESTPIAISYSTQ